MKTLVIISTCIAVAFARPLNHDSENDLVRSSRSTTSSTQCYFSELRKNILETKNRPEKSVVSTGCSSDTDIIGSLLTEVLPAALKNEHPLAVLICRGAGICDLDFNDPNVLNQWKNVKICGKHADELLRQWNKQANIRDKHVYRIKTATFGNVDACSMPDGIGLQHENGRPVSRSHLSVQGADAIMKQEHLLVHPGIPLCRAHANYVDELITKLFPPPSKKVKLTPDSEDCTEKIENKDPSYEEPKKKTTRSELVKSFSSFAELAGEKRVCTKKPWDELQPITREKKARAARSLFHTMLGIMVPVGTEEFRKMVHSKTFMTDEWTTGSSLNFENVMKQMSRQFFLADNRRSRLLVLSFVANSVSYLEVVKHIPYLSRYMYQSAKLFGRRKRSQSAPVEKRLERYNSEAVRAFIDFITSPTVMIGLPYGERKVTMSDGSKVVIQDSIRQQTATEIIEMWTKICQENGHPDLLLSPSTMYKILHVCAATKKESTQCVDYFIADGAEAFDEMHRITGIWKNEGLLEHQSLKRLDTEIFETEQYFRTDFRLHIKSHSRVADHCANFALSDPNDNKLASPCSADNHKHVHDLKCDRCQRANTTLERLKEYAEEFVSETRNQLAIVQDDMRKTIEDNLVRREEELGLIKQGIFSVSQMRKHLLRAAFTSQEREEIISSLKNNEALVTLDFAQKFYPKFHREKQCEYFGKKGISYHIAHVTAKIGDVYVQHSFVHIYSGSVTQDSTLVILTIAHFLQELEKVGIERISLRSDNAGAYHSAAAIGSLHWLNETTTVDIQSWSFSEAQNGKSSSDRDANRVKHKAKNYVDKGKDIATSDDFFAALKENPLNGVSVYHGSVTPDANSGKTEWKGISSLNHFAIESNGLRGRRYGTIGDGHLFEKSALKPIKGTFQFNDEAGFIASNIVSKNEERNAVLSGGKTKFWYHPQCAKASKCVKEDDVVTDQIEEDLPETKIGDLYACPTLGCSATFLRYSNLEKHNLKGQHKIAPERMTERDFAVNLFSRRLEDVNESKTFPTVEAALKELKETKEDSSIKQGWGLPEKRTRKAFEEETKKFLISCFNEGIVSKAPLSPFAIQNRMRTAKNASGGKKFTVEQILTVPQIAGFLSREANKRKSASTSRTSQCKRSLRFLRRHHHHRRRRNGCKNEKDNVNIVSNEEHQDSEWIAFLKSEEFWTQAEEYYKAVLDKFDEIFEKEPEEKARHS